MLGLAIDASVKKFFVVHMSEGEPRAPLRILCAHFDCHDSKEDHHYFSDMASCSPAQWLSFDDAKCAQEYLRALLKNTHELPGVLEQECVSMPQAMVRHLADAQLRCGT